MRRGRRRAEKSGGDRDGGGGPGGRGQQTENSEEKDERKGRVRGGVCEKGGWGRRHQQRLLSGTVTTAVHLSECKECSSFSLNAVLSVTASRHSIIR